MSVTDVEVRHLAAMRAVARHRSFSKAATELGFTQSAISQQIAALEKSVGEALFVRPRGPRPVELTPAGKLLLGHATTVLDQLEVAQAELEAFRLGHAGPLHIGSFQSVSTRVLPRVVAALRKEHDDIDLTMMESDQQSLLVTKLLEGELDLSFLVAPIHHERIETSELCDDPFVVISPAGSPTTPMPFSDLADLPLIGQHPTDACQTRIDTGLRSLGIEPRYVFRSGDNGAVQAMVRAGEGHSVMARLAIDLDDPGVVVRAIDPPIPPRTILIGHVADRPLAPAAQRFLEHARKVCVEVVERSPA